MTAANGGHAPATGKRVFVPGFFTHPIAEAMFTQAGIELVWGFPETGHTYEAASLAGVGDPSAVALSRLETELGQIQALHAMGPSGPLPIDASVMERAPSLEVIFIQAAGVDSIDIAAATERGIVVLNAPGANSRAVAEHALALMLSLARFITSSDRRAHSEGRSDASAVYDSPVAPSILCGKTLGLIGLGHVGRAVSRIAQSGFGMTLLAVDPVTDRRSALELGVELVTIDALLSRSDFVSLHAPLSSETEGIIDTNALALMRPTAYLINTSRGGLVDTDALVAALEQRKIAGAALDVTDPEPLPDGHPLFRLDNLTITPHIASLCSESREATSRISTELVVSALRGERPNQMLNPTVWPTARANPDRR